MKPNKELSVLLSVFLCVSMVLTPVGVLADETPAPSEEQTTEATEKPETKETEKPTVKETKKPEPTEKTVESTEKSEPEVKETEPTEGKNPEATEEKTPEPTEDKKVDPSETKTTEEIKESPAETTEETETPSVKGKIPEQNVKKKAKNEGNTALSGRYDIAVVWTYENGTITFNKSFDTQNPTYALNEGNISVSIGDGVVDSYYEDEYGKFKTCFDNATNCVIGEGIESIGEWLFSGHKKLTSLTIAKSVKEVGYFAFNNCKSLKTVTITKELYDEIVMTPRLYTIGTAERFDNDGRDIHFIFSTQAENPLKVKGKTATVKYKKLRKKNKTLSVSKVIAFTKKGQGKLTYAKVSGNKKILINKTTGKITVKKKIKKKTYKVKVRIKAAGNEQYKPSGWKTVTFKIKVK